MKKATREITVYSDNGQGQVATLSRGDAVEVIGEDTGGMRVALSVGRVLAADAAYLVDEAQWAAQTSARDRLVAHAAAQEQNGSIYVLGAQGQTGSQITEAWIKTREHNDASNYNRAIALWKKRLGQGYANLHAYDCSGLVVAFLLAEKLIGGDMNANGLYYTACDATEKDALIAGDLVFKKYLTNSRVYHVGVYMGDGTVVHAKGRDYGVIREALSKGGWNRFGRLKCFGEPAAPVYTRALKNKGKPYMCGDDVRAVQAALEAAGFSPDGVDGSYGPKTEAAVKAYQAANGLEADGIAGPKTWAKLFG
jgi:cell wall-associated NlpC family hydrolase